MMKASGSACLTMDLMLTICARLKAHRITFLGLPLKPPRPSSSVTPRSSSSSLAVMASYCSEMM